MKIIVDDFELARKFIYSLPKSVKRSRFGEEVGKGVPSEWNPNHVVLALKNGRVVAISDLVESAPSEFGKAGWASIVAHKRMGGYAIAALLKMMKFFPKNHWCSSIMQTTPSLVKISRRFMDETYDQVAIQLSRELVKRHGELHYFKPSPLFISQKTIKRLKLPDYENMDGQTKLQILEVAQNPMEKILKAPNGDILDAGTLMSLAFDVANTPFVARQGMSRMLLITTSMMHGNMPSKEHVDNLVDPNSMSLYQESLLAAQRSQEAKGNGLFEICSATNHL